MRAWCWKDHGICPWDMPMGYAHEMLSPDWDVMAAMEGAVQGVQ
jgi:hypothetical protein